jgi:mono/diheme cytochrome c family protein
MHPGGDCIGCHKQNGEGPVFTVAGTVMADPAEDTDCNGVSGVTVEITGADGQVIELVTNGAGNFYTEQAVATPYSVKIRKDNAERAMSAAQTETNCASCHTAEGANGAPGRILVPEAG